MGSTVYFREKLRKGFLTIIPLLLELKKPYYIFATYKILNLTNRYRNE